MNTKKYAATIAAAAAICLTGTAADAESRFADGARDAWLTGRIETLYVLNEHLNPFEINTDVEGGIVRLTGTVHSQIDRDLAEELARGIDGVEEVDNDLVVAAVSPSAVEPESGSERRDFGSWVDDATTTAAVKSRLIRNASTKGLQIDVDTKDDIVTLSGRVSSEEERALAAQIALNSSDVTEVRNNLVVDPS